jgi:vancomycin permeability regulator SanA
MLYRLVRRLTWGAVILAVFLLGAMLAVAIAGLRTTHGPAHLAVVLGNEVLADGTPSPRLRARLDTAFALYQAGLVRHVLLSGGQGKSGYDEATVMAGYLRTRGVPDPALYLDAHGVNSYATALHTAAIMREHGWSSAIAVTQYFHLPRTTLALHRAGVPYVQGAYPRYWEWRDLYSLAREVAGLAWYRVRPFPEFATGGA